MNYKEEIKQAEQKGGEDWAAGVPYDSNPYPFSLKNKNEDTYWAWFRGWLIAAMKAENK